MSRTISPTAVTAGMTPETSEVFLTLIEIDHTSLSSPIRVVDNNEDIVSNGNTYSGAAFLFTLPSQADDKLSPAKLTIDNVDRRIVEAVRTINSPADMTVSIILASDPDTIEVGPYDFKLKNVSYDAQQVTGDLLYLQYLDNTASTVIMNNQNFPALNEWT